MSKHTPGPWVIERNSGLQIYITQPQDKANRTPGFYAEVRRFKQFQPEIEANARLIAAAPEMLEALEMVQAVIDLGNASGDSSDAFAEWSADHAKMVLAVESALKKSRGEK